MADNFDWVKRLAVVSGQSPQQLLFMMRKTPRDFARLAASHGFKPPERAAASKEQNPSYSLPTLGEMVSGFGQDKNVQEARPSTVPAKGSSVIEEPLGKVLADWWNNGGTTDPIISLGGADNAAARKLTPAPSEAPAPVEHVAPPSAPPAEAAPAPGAGLSGAVPTPRVDLPKPGTPEPKTVEELNAATGGSGTSAGSSNPAAAGFDSQSAALREAAKNVAIATQDTGGSGPNAPSIGAALSGIKAPPPPNPLPGAGVPHPSALPQTTAEDVLKALGLALTRSHQTSLRNAV